MRYPSDLTHEQWSLLRPSLPTRAKTGRPPADRRTVIDDIPYLLRAGYAWPMPPKDFGSWSPVVRVLRDWVESRL